MNFIRLLLIILTFILLLLPATYSCLKKTEIVNIEQHDNIETISGNELSSLLNLTDFQNSKYEDPPWYSALPLNSKEVYSCDKNIKIKIYIARIISESFVRKSLIEIFQEANTHFLTFFEGKRFSKPFIEKCKVCCIEFGMRTVMPRSFKKTDLKNCLDVLGLSDGKRDMSYMANTWDEIDTLLILID